MDLPTCAGELALFELEETVEQEHILTVAQHVEALGGTREDAAQILGIGRSTLCKKLTDYQHNSDAEQTVRKSP